MGKLLLRALPALLILVIGAAAMLLLAHSEPSTESLDKDLLEVRTQLKNADVDAAKYSGGAILAFIELRRATLRATETMLDQKRLALLRRIDMRFDIPGQVLQSAGAERLKQISSDIEAMDAKLAKDEADAARYGGGLLQTISLMSLATDRLTRSQLTFTYFCAKYGIAVPVDLNPHAKGRLPESIPGKPVKDKDAF